MKTQVSKTALLALQWSVGVVLFVEAALLAYSRTAIHFQGDAGIHHWILLALAWAEMLACVIFLIPGVMKLGARLLITVLALAALFHVLHGSLEIGGLIIFAAAVAVVASQTQVERP
jgi:TRAP-type mannitol/chloroaromatic compound transport system permease small subunit